MSGWRIRGKVEEQVEEQKRGSDWGEIIWGKSQGGKNESRSKTSGGVQVGEQDKWGTKEKWGKGSHAGKVELRHDALFEVLPDFLGSLVAPYPRSVPDIAYSAHRPVPEFA
eukprot:1118447-Rhodomonas_salina.2